MGRRRGAPEGAFTFDLVPDGSEAGREPAFQEAADPGESAGAVPGPASGARRRWSGRARRVRWVGVLGLVGVLAAVVLVDGAADRWRGDDLRAAAGGVTDLSGPPFEAWSLNEDIGGLGLSGGLVAMQGEVVAVHRHDELVGIDLATGRPRWTVQLDEADGSCGPGMAVWGDTIDVRPAELVVCVAQEIDGEAHVTVVEDDGSVLVRRTVEGDHDLVVPGPRGTVVSATWVGDPEDVDVDLRGDPLTNLTVIGEIDDGYDLELSAADAVTGEERWVTTVPFGQVRDRTQCVSWDVGGRNARVDRRATLDHAVGRELIGVAGCGILAYLTPEGKRLDVPDVASDDDDVVRRVRPLADGGYVVSSGVWNRPALEHDVLGADGEHLYSVEGRVLDPLSTVGGDADELLVAYAARTIALDRTGEELWRADINAERLLARTDDVAVVLDSLDRVVGLGREDGAVRWVRDDLVVQYSALVGGGRSGELEAAFTDGTVVAVVVPTYTGERVLARWNAVDAATGEDLWSTELSSDGWGLDLAAAGHLLRWSPRGLTGYATGS
ncbi:MULTISPECIES: PQQ-binding-like beta-propeller repeat protein [unclassified Isoptericola]|uniref:outer membrane protein assembly factor BamB family protein n=1 Tax=unclassified Isoptericola TaxID=2623355 RepID=UPI00271249AE|nr:MULTISPECIES: PQQ-binding-like beta-propeller repeat protein [unclassified Isoptericola]MDO8145798.1 PQQ-binding-like beta-propeller repeat protein [Isoptericola sp. 178]MDO8149879.1 PQQ-binding-like beta-propeller repeat protein [Isoptericola sp. b408]